MTKAEYEVAKRDPTRWLIDFGNCVIECSKAERTEYYRMYYRYFNSRKCKNGRDADMVSLNSVNEAVSYGMSVFAVHNEPTIDDIVICRMYAVVKGTDSELPALLAAWLSLRIGEVIGLQFQDVDLEKRQINVRRTIVMTEEGYMVRDGCKTEKSVRSIRVPDYILNLIQAQPHEAETDFIIPRTRKSVYSKFKRLMEKNGIDLTFHGLRHLNASIMLMLGIPDKYAMERGGWSTDNILKSVYQQTFSTEREKVDDLIDKYFSGIIKGLEEAESAQI